MKIEISQTYSEWENNLKDLVVRARIQARIERLAQGNAGQHRVLTGGVCELKLNFDFDFTTYEIIDNFVFHNLQIPPSPPFAKVGN